VSAPSAEYVYAIEYPVYQQHTYHQAHKQEKAMFMELGEHKYVHESHVPAGDWLLSVPRFFDPNLVHTEELMSRYAGFFWVLCSNAEANGFMNETFTDTEFGGTIASSPTLNKLRVVIHYARLNDKELIPYTAPVPGEAALHEYRLMVIYIGKMAAYQPIDHKDQSMARFYAENQMPYMPAVRQKSGISTLRDVELIARTMRSKRRNCEHPFELLKHLSGARPDEIVVYSGGPSVFIL